MPGSNKIPFMSNGGSSNFSKEEELDVAKTLIELSKGPVDRTGFSRQRNNSRSSSAPQERPHAPPNTVEPARRPRETIAQRKFKLRLVSLIKCCAKGPKENEFLSELEKSVEPHYIISNAPSIKFFTLAFIEGFISERISKPADLLNNPLKRFEVVDFEVGIHTLRSDVGLSDAQKKSIGECTAQVNKDAVKIMEIQRNNKIDTYLTAVDAAGRRRAHLKILITDIYKKLDAQFPKT